MLYSEHDSYVEARGVTHFDEEKGRSAAKNASHGGCGVDFIHIQKRGLWKRDVNVCQAFHLSCDDIAHLQLWDDAAHRCLPGQQIPEELSCGQAFALTAAYDDWNVTRPDYIKASFTWPSRVYLLIPSSSVVPPWVGSSFRQLHHQGGQEASLEVRWRLPGHTWLLAIMTGRLASCYGARLNIWECKEACRPGQVYKFGGPQGTKMLSDFTYVFAWRLLDSDLDPARGKGGEAGVLLPVLPHGPSGNCGVHGNVDAARDGEGGDDDGHLAQLTEQADKVLESVLQNNLASLVDACQAYRQSDTQLPAQPTARPSTSAAELPTQAGSGADIQEDAIATILASKRNDAKPVGGAGNGDHGNGGAKVATQRPSFLLSDGQPLTSLAAARRADPRLLAYLVSQGAELDERALRYLLHYDRCLLDSGYRDVQHFILSYIVHQRNPIACTLVFAAHLEQVIKADKRQRPQYGGLVDRLRSLAVQLVKALAPLNLRVASRNPVWGRDEDAIEASSSGGGFQSASALGKPMHTGVGIGVVGAAGMAVASDTAVAATGGSPEELPERADERKPRATLGDVLSLKGVACSINDYSPLQLAFENKYMDFIATDLVQDYLDHRWRGVGYSANCRYHALTLDPATGRLLSAAELLNPADNHLTLRALHCAGFTCNLGALAFRYLSYMQHALVVAPRPFFDSPRGRYLFRLMSEVLFLYVFHASNMADNANGTGISWQQGIFAFYVMNTLADKILELMYLYKGNMLDYIANGANLLESIALLVLVVSGCLKISFTIVGPSSPNYEALRKAKIILVNTAGVLMWARLLQFLIPLYSGVGALLMVIARVFPVFCKFILTWLILTIGVAFALYTTFRDRGIPAFSTFTNTLLVLLRTFLGESMFNIMAVENDGVYNAYGNAIVSVYAFCSTVLMSNLLIALMALKARPFKAKVMSKYLMAQILTQYEFVTENHMLGTPFTLPLLLIYALLPSGRRPMSSNRLLYKAGLMPLDGNLAPNDCRAAKQYPTGSRELPYLVFLLTGYPLIMIAVWLLGLAMAPYSIIFFTFVGYSRWRTVNSVKADPGLHDHSELPFDLEAGGGGCGGTYTSECRPPVQLMLHPGKTRALGTKGGGDKAAFGVSPAAAAARAAKAVLAGGVVVTAAAVKAVVENPAFRTAVEKVAIDIVTGEKSITRDAKEGAVEICDQILAEALPEAGTQKAGSPAQPSATTGRPHPVAAVEKGMAVLKPAATAATTAVGPQLLAVVEEAAVQAVTQAEAWVLAEAEATPEDGAQGRASKGCWPWSSPRSTARMLDLRNSDSRLALHGTAGSRGIHPGGAPSAPSALSAARSPFGPSSPAAMSRIPVRKVHQDSFLQRMRIISFSLVAMAVNSVVVWPARAALGVAIYIFGLWFVVELLWLGVYQWLYRILAAIFFVLLGWMEGWSGALHPPSPSDPSELQLIHDGGLLHWRRVTSIVRQLSEGPMQRPAAYDGGTDAEVGSGEVHGNWIRLRQSLLRDDGQVLSLRAISKAMLAAGFEEGDVAAALHGPDAPSVPQTGQPDWKDSAKAVAAPPSEPSSPPPPPPRPPPDLGDDLSLTSLQNVAPGPLMKAEQAAGRLAGSAGHLLAEVLLAAAAAGDRAGITPGAVAGPVLEPAGGAVAPGYGASVASSRVLASQSSPVPTSTHVNTLTGSADAVDGVSLSLGAPLPLPACDPVSVTPGSNPGPASSTVCTLGPSGGAPSGAKSMMGPAPGGQQLEGGVNGDACPRCGAVELMTRSLLGVLKPETGVVGLIHQGGPVPIAQAVRSAIDGLVDDFVDALKPVKPCGVGALLAGVVEGASGVAGVVEGASGVAEAVDAGSLLVRVVEGAAGVSVGAAGSTRLAPVGGMEPFLEEVVQSAIEQAGVAGMQAAAGLAQAKAVGKLYEADAVEGLVGNAGDQGMQQDKDVVALLLDVPKAAGCEPQAATGGGAEGAAGPRKAATEVLEGGLDNGVQVLAAAALDSGIAADSSSRGRAGRSVNSMEGLGSEMESGDSMGALERPPRRPVRVAGRLVRSTARVLRAALFQRKTRAAASSAAAKMAAALSTSTDVAGGSAVCDDRLAAAAEAIAVPDKGMEGLENTGQRPSNVGGAIAVAVVCAEDAAVTGAEKGVAIAGAEGMQRVSREASHLFTGSSRSVRALGQEASDVFGSGARRFAQQLAARLLDAADAAPEAGTAGARAGGSTVVHLCRACGAGAGAGGAVSGAADISNSTAAGDCGTWGGRADAGAASGAVPSVVAACASGPGLPSAWPGSVAGMVAPGALPDTAGFPVGTAVEAAPALLLLQELLMRMQRMEEALQEVSLAVCSNAKTA